MCVLGFTSEESGKNATNFPELPCAYDHAVYQISERFPFYKSAIDLTFREAIRRGETVSTREIYTIPVVFHVVYNNDAQNKIFRNFFTNFLYYSFYFWL